MDIVQFNRVLCEWQSDLPKGVTLNGLNDNYLWTGTTPEGYPNGTLWLNLFQKDDLGHSFNIFFDFRPDISDEHDLVALLNRSLKAIQFLALGTQPKE